MCGMPRRGARRGGASGRGGGLPWLHQVPQVAVQVLEDGHGAIGLDLGLPHEDDALRRVGPVVAPEVVGVQEQEDTTAGLIANSLFLLRRRSFSKNWF